MAQRYTRMSKKRPADAIQMLEAGHRKVEKLFNDFLKAETGRQRQIAQEIFRDLEVHSTLEEEIFYPALQKQEEAEELMSRKRDASTEDEDNEAGEDGAEAADDELIDNAMMSAYDDHRMIRDQITRLRQMEVSTPEFRQGLVELQEMVTLHVSVEEDELFTHAQLSVDTKTLGRHMQERKAGILSAAA